MFVASQNQNPQGNRICDVPPQERVPRLTVPEIAEFAEGSGGRGVLYTAAATMGKSSPRSPLLRELSD
jgi:hypothetical protein